MTKRKSTATRRAESEAAATRAAAIRAEQERSERRRRTLVVTAVVVAVLAVVLVIGYVVSSGQDDSGKPTTEATTPGGVVGGYAVPAGPSSAPVKVAVYEDFMCPFCGQFEAASRASLEQHIRAGDVQVQYHVLNFLDRSSSTEYSTRAANALAVVLDTSGPEVAKKFHDLLFEHQPAEGSAGLSDEELVDFAVQAGAEKSAVRPGIEDRQFETWVHNVTDRASKDGVTGTPTVRVDGKTLQYDSTDELVTELDKAITDAG